MKILVAIFALLVFASPAQAGWRKDRALQISRVVWHSPCVDRAQVVVIDQKILDEGADLIYGAHVMARADRENCRILVGQVYKPSRTPWRIWCSIVIHESGHLAGYHNYLNSNDPDHSLDPGSIMYESIDSEDDRCESRGRPYLEKHGVLSPHPRS